MKELERGKEGEDVEVRKRHEWDVKGLEMEVKQWEREVRQLGGQGVDGGVEAQMLNRNDA